jgi:uncharacterized protein (TIGR02145 family)
MKTMKSLCGMLAVLAFTACSNDSDEAAGSGNHVWHVSLTASMGDATNRALDADGNTITAKFAASEEVKVVKSNGSVVGTLTPQTVGTKTTTLTGEITGSFSNNEVLTLRYHSETANYDNQVGTLVGISANQDNAEATLTITDATSMTFVSNSVTFKSKQSITKFSFNDGTNPISVKTFGIAAPGLVQSIAANGTETVGAVTGTLATPSSDVYVALRNKETGTKTYSFTIQDKDGNWYIFTKDANLSNGKNYTATVSMTKLANLTSPYTVGTVGVIDGLPAIVVDFSGTKKAVALMNAGALCPEHYGKYYTFANLSSLGLPIGWYVPTKDEFDALVGKTNAWVTQNGVAGRQYTIVTGKTLFFPAAGYDLDPSHSWTDVTTLGYYWSLTSASTELGYCYSFSSANNNTISHDKDDGLSVRPFHNL